MGRPALFVERQIGNPNRRIERSDHREGLSSKDTSGCPKASLGRSGIVFTKQGQFHPVDSPGRVDLVDRELSPSSHVDPGR